MEIKKKYLGEVKEGDDYNFLLNAVDDRRCFGEMFINPDKRCRMDVSLGGVSHMINNIIFDDGHIYGDIEILDTNQGKILKAHINSGIPISISERSKGEVGKNGRVTIQTILSYDIVPMSKQELRALKIKKLMKRFST